MSGGGTLLTASGAILSEDDAGVFAAPFALAARLRPVEVPAAEAAATPQLLRFLGDRDVPQTTLSEGPLAGCTLGPGARRGTWALRRGETLLGPGTDGRLAAMPRTRPTDADSLLLLTPGDLRLLRDILDNAWVRRSTAGRVDEARIALAFPFLLEIEGARHDLRHHLPFQGARLPHRVNLFRDAWRLDELCLLRPLVTVTCFGEAEAARLAGFLGSLREAGGFAGHVLVVTERSPEAVFTLLDGSDTRDILVRTMADAGGAVARILARYGALDAASLIAFQPILMLDTQVVVERPLAPVLEALALCDRIAAPLAPKVARLHAPLSGLGMLQRDGIDCGAIAAVDPAVLGVPNLAMAAPALALLRRIVADRAIRAGDAPVPPWLESEVVNYVAFAGGQPFDTHLLTGFVGGPGEGAVLTRHVTDEEGRATRLGPRRHDAVAGAPGLRVEEPAGSP